MQAGSQYRRYAEPVGQMQNGKWVSAKNKAGLTLRFENSGGKPPGPYCRDLDEAPAEGEVCFLCLPDSLYTLQSAALTLEVPKVLEPANVSARKKELHIQCQTGEEFVWLPLWGLLSWAP